MLVLFCALCRYLMSRVDECEAVAEGLQRLFGLKFWLSRRAQPAKGVPYFGFWKPAFFTLLGAQKRAPYN